MRNYLYSRGRLWPITLGPAQKLSQARVQHQDAFLSLSDQLAQLGTLPLAQRFPVLAIGSNAYPRQLYDKFHGAGIEDSLPSFGARLHACQIAYCPYVAGKGYVPATPRYQANWQAIVWLQLLTPEQLALIRASESDYHLVQLDPACSLIVEDSGETIPDSYLFWHPEILAWPNAPTPVLAHRNIDPAQAITHPRTQADLLRDLASFHFPQLGDLATAKISPALLQAGGGRQALNVLLRQKHGANNELPAKAGRIIAKANSPWDPTTKLITYDGSV
ncbi:MAG: hypothetical protein GKR89_06360 [Candidatus Latescibacteria bacterium]|nr:hypothetical protein [Candidatus Latescibacterota bacterium]